MANRYFLNIGVNWGDINNWSDTSGGAGGFSVPTNADDVFFDGSSGNCTVNASNRTAKTLNFTGYTNTITMTNNITVSGNITLAAAMGVAGTGQLIVNTTSTLTSNGKTWSADFTFSGTSQTYTLGDAWTISGNLRLSSTTACTINSNSITSSGNLTSTSTATTSGTTSITITGGTWSNSSTGALRNNLTINGNCTVSGTVRYDTGTLTYTSGTVTTTGSTLTIAASTTLNTSTLSWNNVTFGVSTAITITLSSNFVITGTMSNPQNNTFNGAFNITTSGTITAGGSIGGTATLYMIGGTLNSTNNITANLTFDGNISIAANIAYSTRTIRYISGNITLPSNHLLTVSGTVDTNSLVWDRVTINVSPITFSSDFNVGGLLTHSNNISYNGAFNLNLYGGLNLSGGDMNAGTMTVNLYGGTWSVTNPTVYQSRLSLPTVIRGNITISGNVYFGGTLTYVNGVVNTSSATLNLLFASTFVNCDKINFRSVVITSGTTQTFNRFFNGTASNPTRIQCLTATGTYTVAFQDTFEKISFNTKVSGCVVNQRNQLILTSPNANKGLNTGVRYSNQYPNGLPLNASTVPTQMVFGIGNISDPTIVTT